MSAIKHSTAPLPLLWPLVSVLSWVFGGGPPDGLVQSLTLKSGPSVTAQPGATILLVPMVSVTQLCVPGDDQAPPDFP